MRKLVGFAGALIMLFGLGCLNYTKIGNVERHSRVAQQRGWPAPSRGIAYLGLLFAPLGAGLVGFALGRRRSGVADAEA